MPVIHPAASVHASAELADDVRVEAGACVEAGVRLGEGSVVGRHSIIWRDTVIGRRNRIFPFCSLGGEPQDKKYAGEAAPLIIGDDNTVREYCFINKGTQANGETRIGDRNWIMGYVHIAHDCIFGNDITVSNCAQFAGHITVGDRAIIGGGVLVQQFLRIGGGAFIGGSEALRLEPPPWSYVGRGVVDVNDEGMKRNGFNEAQITAMHRAYRLLYRSDLPLQAAVEKIKALPEAESPSSSHQTEAALPSPLAELVEFLSAPELRLLRPRRSRE